MSELAAWLRFYRDLGFRDIEWTAEPSPAPLTTPRVAAAPPAPEPAIAAAPPRPRPEPQPEPEPQPAPAPQPASAPKPALEVPEPQPTMASPAAPEHDPLPILQAIQADIGDDCTRCRLHEGRSKIVFGSGSPTAKLVFVGEGPGADEDVQGLPFVGRAGQLLTQMIDRTAEGEGIAIRREHVYICNVVKCRPPGNRAPEPDEMATCGQFLERQLKAIRPKAICVLGSTAAKALLQTSTGITKLRGEWRQWGDIPVMPTFHPSFLLRAYNKEAKRQAWEDLKKVLHFVYD
ncbi:MAG: uracil-DNA glycosylase [Acidobacteria bacterium]|nr:uracil-DNA glycosylase [Acidobacteriota bacterium]